VKSPRSTPIPKTMQGTYDAVVALTDTFCRENLNDEYRDVASVTFGAHSIEELTVGIQPARSYCGRDAASGTIWPTELRDLARLGDAG
jgi:hypothetical protein